jgi:hypothetical protein
MGEHKHGEMDISVHEKTFDNFIAWTKWSVIGLVLFFILMAIFAV